MFRSLRFTILVLLLSFLLISPALAGGWVEWRDRFGAENTSEAGRAVAVWGGRVYMAGDTRSPLSGSVQRSWKDAFLRDYDLDGTAGWVRQFGVAEGSWSVNDIAVGAQGNVYVVGERGLSGFLRKYSAAGQLLWDRKLGKTAVGSGLAIGGRGAVYVVGRTLNTLPNQELRGDMDAFVRKYSPRGGIYWTRQIGTAGRDELNDVAVDSQGAVYVAGQTTNAFPNQESQGGGDAFIRKYSPRGGIHWTRQFGKASNESAEALAVTPNGDVYVVGTSAARAFGRKYAADGTRLWTRLWRDHKAYSAAADGDVSLFVGGRNASAKAFIRKFDQGGDKRWDHHLANGTVFDLTVGEDGRLYVAGMIDEPMASSGQSDVFTSTGAGSTKCLGAQAYLNCANVWTGEPEGFDTDAMAAVVNP